MQTHDEMLADDERPTAEYEAVADLEIVTVEDGTPEDDGIDAETLRNLRSTDALDDSDDTRAPVDGEYAGGV